RLRRYDIWTRTGWKARLRTSRGEFNVRPASGPGTNRPRSRELANRLKARCRTSPARSKMPSGDRDGQTKRASWNKVRSKRNANPKLRAGAHKSAIQIGGTRSI